MKTRIHAGACLLGFMMVLLAQALLVGSVDAIASGGSVKSFGLASATVDNTPFFLGSTAELTWSVDGILTIDSSSVDIDISFDFFAIGSDQYLRLLVERTSSDEEFTVSNVSANFSNWTHSPAGYVLSGFALEEGTLDGLTVTPTSNSIGFALTNFVVDDESRAVGLRLIFEEDGGGTTDPIPEPTSLALLATGLGGLMLRRRFA